MRTEALELGASREAERDGQPSTLASVLGAPVAFPNRDSGGTLLGPQILFGAWKFHNFSQVIACLNYAISLRKCSCIIRACNQTMTAISGEMSGNQRVL